MSVLRALIQVEVWLFLGAVSLIVLHRLVSGGINIGEAQLNRAQLLLSVIAVAAYYLAMVISRRELPSVPGAVIAALGGSNVIHLASTLAQRWPATIGSWKSP